MKKLILIALMLPAVAWAKPNILTWSDNSDNEAGFEMRGRLTSGEWEVLGRTVANISEFEVEGDDHDAWQVFAFDVWDQYSDGSNIFEKGEKPNAPGSLRVKRGNPITKTFNRILNRKNRRS